MITTQIISELPNLKAYKVISTKPIIILAQIKHKGVCIYCGKNGLWVKHKYLRSIRHVSVGRGGATLRYGVISTYASIVGGILIPE